MPKIEKAQLTYLTGMRYKPDIEIELRPDKKRLVIRQRNNVETDPDEVRIALADVAALCTVMTNIVKQVRINRIIEDSALEPGDA